MEKQQQQSQCQFIRVVAPATLEEGYTFDVMLEGEAFTVTVPDGGVVKGEEFEIPYPATGTTTIMASDEEEEGTVDVRVSEDQEDDDKDHSNRTTTRLTSQWRTSLCSCCDVVTQATFWLGFCCAPVLIAQLVTRLQLSWKGKLESRDETALSFNKILLSFIAVLILGYIPVIGFFIILGYLFCVIVMVGKNVRYEMRRRYQIPASTRCEAFDDCMCMCFCGGCSAIQMARHTHNDKVYPGNCYTITGLDPDAPQVMSQV
jgi:Cys-rich protein (TIGR01571 family)